MVGGRSKLRAGDLEMKFMAEAYREGAYFKPLSLLQILGPDKVGRPAAVSKAQIHKCKAHDDV